MAEMSHVGGSFSILLDRLSVNLSDLCKRYPCALWNKEVGVYIFFGKADTPLGLWTVKSELTPAWTNHHASLRTRAWVYPMWPYWENGSVSFLLSLVMRLHLVFATLGCSCLNSCWLWWTCSVDPVWLVGQSYNTLSRWERWLKLEEQVAWPVSNSL